jgi:hypothetical protein
MKKLSYTWTDYLIYSVHTVYDYVYKVNLLNSVNLLLHKQHQIPDINIIHFYEYLEK